MSRLRWPVTLLAYTVAYARALGWAAIGAGLLWFVRLDALLVSGLFVLAAGAFLAMGWFALRDAGFRARRWLDARGASSHDVAIGADGIRSRGVFGTRVVPWREVARLSAEPGRYLTLVAHLADGRAIRWRLAEAVGAFDAARAALDRHRKSSPAPAIAELSPPERDLDGWIEHVRSLLASSSSDYRAKAVTPEALLRVAEDPTAPVGARVGSVLALSAADEAAKVRVRVAIDETADPVVAELLTDALSGKVSHRRLARASSRG